MGYKIVYGEDPKIQRKDRFWSGRMRLMTAVFFLLFILSVKLVFEEDARNLREILLPGTVNAADTAIGQLVSNLHEGTPVKDAVTAFCRQIIAGAQIG